MPEPVRGNDLVQSPLKIFANGIIDPNGLVTIQLSLQFGVHIVESRAKERVDIESPVDPPSKLLPTSDCVSSFWFSPLLELVNEFLKSFWGEGICHGIRVDCDAYYGNGVAMNLLLRLVRNADLIP